MTGDNLTRAEAFERSRVVSGVSYDVALDLTGDDQTYGCRTTVRFACAEPGSSTFLDFDAPEVHAITLNGRKVPGDAFASDRIRLDGLEAHNEVVIDARSAYRRTGVGLHYFRDPVDGNVYLHTQFEPFDAHRVYPCFDQPDLKGTWALEVNAPAGFTVVSCGVVTQRPPDGAAGVWRFETTPPVSTYITAIVAGPFHGVHERHGDIPASLYCRKSLAQHLDADQIFEVTRQGLDFFAEEFGHPYPFGKYDQLFVPEFNAGAMENAGCVTFNERYVFRSKITDEMLERRTGTILHEMSHMWFGDLVTMKWWDDLWLNESFATYMATDAAVRATRFRNGWVRFATGTKAAAVSQDQLPSTHPISADIVDTDAVRSHFDGITYSKGASVLRQLVAWVGEDAFRGGVREYFQRHAFGNADLRDFLDALERASGRDLGAWSKEWLETTCVNTLRPELELGGKRIDSLAIKQEATADHPTLRSHRVAVGLFDARDGRLERRRAVELDVSGERTNVAQAAGEAQPDLLLLNDGDLTYAKVRLDDRSLATLFEHLSGLADPLARALCWAAAWDMVRDAELPARAYVDLVVSHAPHEPEASTLGGLLARAATAIDVFGEPSNRARARGLLAARSRRGLEDNPAGSDVQLAWGRTLVSTADAGDELALVRGLLDGTRTVEGLAVDTDLRWSIVGHLARLGAAGQELVEAEEQRDPTDIGRRHAEAARASMPVPESKARAWKQLVDERSIPLATMRSIAAGFSQWGQEDVLEPYVEAYFDALPSIWRDRGVEEARLLTRALFPNTLVSERVVASTGRALLSEVLPAGAVRTLRERKDDMERTMRARARDASV